jgi:hypothetical protein
VLTTIGMRAPCYALVVGTRGDLESSGHLCGGEVELNGCCIFPVWRRGGDVAVQVVSACQSCLVAIRQIVADPERARQLGGGGEPNLSLKLVAQ